MTINQGDVTYNVHHHNYPPVVQPFQPFQTPQRYTVHLMPHVHRRPARRNVPFSGDYPDADLAATAREEDTRSDASMGMIGDGVSPPVSVMRYEALEQRRLARQQQSRRQLSGPVRGPDPRTWTLTRAGSTGTTLVDDMSDPEPATSSFGPPRLFNEDERGDQNGSTTNTASALPSRPSRIPVRTGASPGLLPSPRPLTSDCHQPPHPGPRVTLLRPPSPSRYQNQSASMTRAPYPVRPPDAREPRNQNQPPALIRAPTVPAISTPGCQPPATRRSFTFPLSRPPAQTAPVQNPDPHQYPTSASIPTSAPNTARISLPPASASASGSIPTIDVVSSQQPRARSQSRTNRQGRTNPSAASQRSHENAGTTSGPSDSALSSAAAATREHWANLDYKNAAAAATREHWAKWDYKNAASH